MKNFLGKLRNIKTEKKSLYLSAFVLICFFVAMPVCSAHAGYGVKDLVDAFVSGAATLVFSIIYWVMYVVFKFASFLVYFAAWLVDMMLNPAMYKSILVGTLDPTTGKYVGAVQTGWQTVRDFCNMFYIFFLLLMAFATIVGNQTYSAKALMPKFIISLFLINFSDVITKMVIDVGQVFLFGMAAWLGTFSGSSGGGSALSGIINYFEALLGSKKDIGFDSIITILFATTYTFCLGGVYLVLAAFLAVRLVMFACLIIVSPFAFFSMVLPSMGKYTSQWQSSLISNAISGPVLIFFVYVSAVMAKNLVDNPVAITTGDTSNMSYLSTILVRIVPHIVALGILLFGVSSAKSVGAAGSNYIVGGRGGIGKMMGMGYAGFKVGERGVRKSAGWARDVSVRNSSGAARLDNAAHGAYQKAVGAAGSVVPYAGGTATNIIMRDKAAHDAAKKKMYDERLKQAGGNLKAIDVDTALKGDNISKAIALNAAAVQGKLGDMEKGKSKYADHFKEASAAMSQSDIKDLTGKNLTFHTMTAENQNRVKSGKDSFEGEAKNRVEASIKLGRSEQDAVRDEIKREKFMGLVDEGEDGKIQDVGDESTARVMVNNYSRGQLADSIKRMSKSKKSRFAEGIETSQKTTREKLKEADTNPNLDKKAIREEYTKSASAAIKSGSHLSGAFARNETGVDSDYEKILNEYMESEDKSPAGTYLSNKADIDTIVAIDNADLKEEGWRLDHDKVVGVAAKKDNDALTHIKASLKEKQVAAGGPGHDADIDDKLKTVQGKLS